MFYEQILNNHLLHEKLAENINKQLLNSSNNRSKDRSLLSTSQDQGPGPSTSQHPSHSGDQVHPSASADSKPSSSQQGEGLALTSADDVEESLKDVSGIFSDAGPGKPEAQMSNSLNTDLNDILDLHVRNLKTSPVENR